MVQKGQGKWQYRRSREIGCSRSISSTGSIERTTRRHYRRQARQEEDHGQTARRCPRCASTAAAATASSESATTTTTTTTTVPETGQSTTYHGPCSPNISDPPSSPRPLS